MKPDLSWQWTSEAYYRSFLATARLDKRNVVLHLPSEPSSPMSALVSHRLMRHKHLHMNLDTKSAHAAVLKACEHLLVTFTGVDLGTTVLIDQMRVTGSTSDGDQFSVMANVLWEAGTFGVFTGYEIELPEDYFVERQLLLTELRHRCEPLEE